jgi:hypothetical protein
MMEGRLQRIEDGRAIATDEKWKKEGRSQRGKGKLQM